MTGAPDRSGPKPTPSSIDKVLTWWLIAWGVLGFTAVSAPGLVVVGIFFILPGLILLAAPTIFGYSAAFAVVRYVFRLRGSAVMEGTAVGIALLLGWAAAQPWHLSEIQEFHRANLPDVLPASPVQLAGDIRLDLPWRDYPKTDPDKCDALCAAVLDTAGVRSVTIAYHERSDREVATRQNKVRHQPVSFRLLPRNNDRSRGASLSKPEDILDQLPVMPSKVGSIDYQVRENQAREAKHQRDRQLVAIGWGLRLAAPQKLIRESNGVRPDMVVRITDERPNGRIGLRVSRVEVLDRGGKALMRRSFVASSPLAAPLRYTCSGGLDSSFRVHLSRENLSSGPEYPELRPVMELFVHSSLSRPKLDPEAIGTALERLQGAAENPMLGADDADLALAEVWIPTIDWSKPLSASQLAVLGAVIADGRILLPKELFTYFGGKRASVARELRGPLATRIINPETTSGARTDLAKLLSSLPSGTFQTLSTDEETILASQELREHAYPLIVRLADRGEAAIPVLFSILKEDTGRPWYKLNRVLEAVSLAFATLGPKAHTALPDLDALVNVKRSGLLNNGSGDRERWDFALARMGKPIEDFKWSFGKPEWEAEARENLRRRVKKFDPTDPWSK